MNIPLETLHLIHQDMAVQYRIVPKELLGNKLSLYADEDCLEDGGLLDELQVVLNYDITLEALPKVEINRLLATHYLKNGQEGGANKQLDAISANDDFLTTLINEAKKLKSSDIHIETFEQKARVRVRIDGMMIERYQIEKKRLSGFDQ